VYGMRPAEAVLVLDKASMRVDVKQHALALGRSVRAALDAKAPEAQVAAAERRTRG